MLDWRKNLAGFCVVVAAVGCVQKAPQRAQRGSGSSASVLNAGATGANSGGAKNAKGAQPAADGSDSIANIEDSEGTGTEEWENVETVDGSSSGTPAASGSEGISGAVGPTGPGGTTGVAGVSGVSGNTGSSGATGVSGATGLIAATGASGLKGASGTTGITAPISTVTVTECNNLGDPWLYHQATGTCFKFTQRVSQGEMCITNNVSSGCTLVDGSWLFHKPSQSWVKPDSLSFKAIDPNSEPQEVFGINTPVLGERDCQKIKGKNWHFQDGSMRCASVDTAQVYPLLDNQIAEPLKTFEGGRCSSLSSNSSEWVGHQKSDECLRSNTLVASSTICGQPGALASSCKTIGPGWYFVPQISANNWMLPRDVARPLDVKCITLVGAQYRWIDQLNVCAKVSASVALAEMCSSGNCLLKSLFASTCAANGLNKADCSTLAKDASLALKSRTIDFLNEEGTTVSSAVSDSGATYTAAEIKCPDNKYIKQMFQYTYKPASGSSSEKTGVSEIKITCVDKNNGNSEELTTASVLRKTPPTSTSTTSTTSSTEATETKKDIFCSNETGLEKALIGFGLAAESPTSTGYLKELDPKCVTAANTSNDKLINVFIKMNGDVSYFNPYSFDANSISCASGDKRNFLHGLKVYFDSTTKLAVKATALCRKMQVRAAGA